MASPLRPALTLLAALTFASGFVYPAAVTATAALLFPKNASGSPVLRGQVPVGSRLLGQNFQSSQYFWGRPSATPTPYDPSASGGSNLGPTNPALLAAVESRAEFLRRNHPDHAKQAIPIDLVTTSGSGLDPHISPAAAEFQIERVARARNLAIGVVKDLVLRHTEPRELGLLGEPRLNVLELNLALDALTQGDAREH